MSAPYGDIENKVEQAIVRHLNGIASNIAGVTIHPSVDTSSLALPHVVAQTLSAEEYPKFSGNYTVEVEVQISSSANDNTAAQHNSRVARIRDEFTNDWVGASMSAHVADFAVHGEPGNWGVIVGSGDRTQEDKRFIHRLPLTIFCRPSD